VAEKRTAWGPPGGVKGICLVGMGAPETEHAARSGQSFYCEDHNKVKTKATVTPAADPSEPESPPSPDGGGGAYSDAERRPGTPPPKSPKRGLTALLGKKSPGGDASPTDSPSSRERHPSANKARRVGTLDFWGDVVEGGASVVGRAGYVPMARSMAWSSPVAGEIIENATKDTFVDKLIQPVVRNQAKWQDLFDLLGLWGAIGIAQANPAQAPVAIKFARGRLVALLPRIAANIKKEREKERKAAEALLEVMPDLREMFPDADPDDDPMDLLMAMLFTAPSPTEQGVPADA
jgi:hypothetical protein